MNRRIRPNLKQAMPPAGHFTGTVALGSYTLWTGIGGYLNYRGTRNNPHAHSHHEVCLVLDGRGWFDHDGTRYDLGADDLFLAHPGVTHEILSHSEHHLKICFISFSITDKNDDRIATQADALVKRFEQDRRVLVPAAGRLALYFQALAGLQPYDNAGSFAESRAVVTSLVTGIMHAAARGLDADAPPKATVDHRVAMAFRFMDDNLARPLSVPELARQSCTSERSLRRLIKAACGRSVIREFARRRIAAAAQRLAGHPEKAIAEIAYDMGYADAAQFGREFKALTGRTPGEWRRNRP